MDSRRRASTRGEYVPGVPEGFVVSTPRDAVAHRAVRTSSRIPGQTSISPLEALRHDARRDLAKQRLVRRAIDEDGSGTSAASYSIKAPFSSAAPGCLARRDSWQGPRSTNEGSAIAISAARLRRPVRQGTRPPFDEEVVAVKELDDMPVRRQFSAGVGKRARPCLQWVVPISPAPHAIGTLEVCTRLAFN